MTSSLVGSEMCIRDSLWPVALGVRLWSPDAHQEQPATDTTRATKPSSGCLLYTSDAADDM
eukprot:10448921-Prorocentrum_lima.AAC.1